MNILLDTHVFLWVVTGSGRLPKAIGAAFLDVDNQPFLSAASYWELCIKCSRGRLDLAEGWAGVFETEMQRNGIGWLGIEPRHCQQLARLPDIHRDPFDRLLVAQAQCEQMVLATADANIARYKVAVLA